MWPLSLEINFRLMRTKRLKKFYAVVLYSHTDEESFPRAANQKYVDDHAPYTENATNIS